MVQHANIDHSGVTGVSGDVATDAIWDAAGDLAVGSGANTAARLAKGSAGGVLAMGNGALIWNAGTSFPGSKATNDRYLRTDLGMEFYWNGTSWVSTQVLVVPSTPYLAGADPGATGDIRAIINATTSGGGGRIIAPSALGGSGIWLVNYRVVFKVDSGASALSGSHKWDGTLVGLDTNIGSTGTAATTTIDSGSSGVFRESTVAIGAAMAAGTLLYTSTWTKTGTPGTLGTGEVLAYRIIAT